MTSYMLLLVYDTGGLIFLRKKEKEREGGERERKRQTDRLTDRQKNRQADIEIDKEREGVEKGKGHKV